MMYSNDTSNEAGSEIEMTQADRIIAMIDHDIYLFQTIEFTDFNHNTGLKQHYMRNIPLDVCSISNLSLITHT